MADCENFRRQASQWRLILGHRSAWLSLGLVVVHQSIVASSAYFLTLVIARFHSKLDYSGALCLYLASMVLPYLPGCLSLFVMQRWINRAHEALISVVSDNLCGRTEIFRDAGLAEKVGAALSSNAMPVLRDCVSFVHDLTTFTLNSALSMLVIGLLLPGEIALGFVASTVLCTMLIVLIRLGVASASVGYERRYMAYAAVLGRAWDNLTLGNVHNEKLWRARRRAAADEFYRDAERLQAVKQAGNAVLAAAALLPTVYVVLEVTTGKVQADPGIVAAIVVSLSRIFLILNSLSAVVYKALDFSSVHARLLVLLDATKAIFDSDQTPEELKGGVQINGKTVGRIAEASQMIGVARSGRITITGPNGSGKSTVLLALKRRFGEKSFFLPANHNRLDWQGDLASLSSGERTKASISEAVQLAEVDMLLLDEWDANLDVSNRHAVDTLLEASSLNKVIVEVRH